MYGVVHGGVFDDLRRESIDFVLQAPFEGIAVGGSLGHSRDAMYALLETRVMPYLYEQAKSWVAIIIIIITIYLFIYFVLIIIIKYCFFLLSFDDDRRIEHFAANSSIGHWRCAVDRASRAQRLRYIWLCLPVALRVRETWLLSRSLMFTLNLIYFYSIFIIFINIL